MVAYAVALQGCCVAVMLELGAALRMSQPTGDEDRPLRATEGNASELVTPDMTSDSTDVFLNGQRWSPAGWVVFRKENKRAYFDMHIPKTAGCSFALDVKRILAPGEGFYSQEMCYSTTPEVMLPPFDKRIAFLRDPTAHVYSQFLECKYDEWGKSEVPIFDVWHFRGLTGWLRHFRGGEEKYDMHCYHPYNMQTRAFLCYKTCHHHQEEPDLKLALERLDSLFFVGITEQYQASVCLFFAKTRPAAPLPRYCNCRNPIDWAGFFSIHVSHNVPRHSGRNLTAIDRDMIRKLTKLDQQLYDHARKRFAREAAEVERTRGVKILCED